MLSDLKANNRSGVGTCLQRIEKNRRELERTVDNMDPFGVSLQQLLSDLGSDKLVAEDEQPATVFENEGIQTSKRTFRCDASWRKPFGARTKKKNELSSKWYAVS